MKTTFQSVVPGADDTLTVTLSNGNRMDILMTSYLDRADFSSLKDKGVWMSLTVEDGFLYWNDMVRLSVFSLLSLLREEKDSGCFIACATAGDDWRLYLQFQNGSSLSIDMEPLLEYSVFAPLVQSNLWKTLRAKERSLLWEDKSLRLELPMNTIFDYFA